MLFGELLNHLFSHGVHQLIEFLLNFRVHSFHVDWIDFQGLRRVRHMLLLVLIVLVNMLTRLIVQELSVLGQLSHSVFVERRAFLVALAAKIFLIEI